MARPSGIRFVNRISDKPYAKKWWIQCQRGQCRVIRSFDKRVDAVEALHEHDLLTHSGVLARLGLTSTKRRTVAEAFDEYVRYVESLEAHGARDSKTSLYYRGIAKFIKAGFAGRYAEELTQEDISRYIVYRKGEGKERTLKQLKALRTAIRNAGITPAWVVRRDDVRPERKLKAEIPADKLRAFIAAMPAGSVERAFTVTKLLTALRNEELYNLRVENVDLDKLTLSFVLKSKRNPRLHVVPLVEQVVEELRPFVVGKKPSDWLFTLDGRKLQQSSLRKRYLAASKKAGFAIAPITSVGSLRHKHVTEAIRTLGEVRRVQEILGHRNVQTTEVYKLDGLPLDQRRDDLAKVAKALTKAPRKARAPRRETSRTTRATRAKKPSSNEA